MEESLQMDGTPGRKAVQISAMVHPVKNWAFIDEHSPQPAPEDRLLLGCFLLDGRLEDLLQDIKQRKHVEGFFE